MVRGPDPAAEGVRAGARPINVRAQRFGDTATFTVPSCRVAIAA
jgi:hypothetical protein